MKKFKIFFNDIKNSSTVISCSSLSNLISFLDGVEFKTIWEFKTYDSHNNKGSIYLEQINFIMSNKKGVRMFNVPFFIMDTSPSPHPFSFLGSPLTKTVITYKKHV